MSLGKSIGAFFLVLLLSKPVLSNSIINGGFETGNLSGWASVGNVTVVSSSFGVTPAQGTYQGLVNNSSTVGYNAFCLPPGCAASQLETLLGVPGGSVLELGAAIYGGLMGSGGSNGSAIGQSFVADAGSVLSFDFDYLTDDGNADFAFISLDGKLTFLATGSAGCTSYPDPAREALGLPGSSLSPTGFTTDCGYRQFSTTLTTSGTHFLGISVVNFLFDNSVPSVVLVDDVVVTPEPSTWLLLASGLVGIVVTTKRGFNRTNA